MEDSLVEGVEEGEEGEDSFWGFLSEEKAPTKPGRIQSQVHVMILNRTMNGSLRNSLIGNCVPNTYVLGLNLCIENDCGEKENVVL